MVKLQKRFAYRYKEKEHYKHQMTISEEVLEKLGWEEGDELDLLPKGDKLIVKRRETVET